MRSLVVALLLGGALGCADGDDELDGERDEFRVDGIDAADDGAAACAVLKLANTADFATLDGEVGLHPLAAASLVAATGTAEDFLVDLAGLDAVDHIGPLAFQRMVGFTASRPAWSCGPRPLQLLAFNDFHGNLEPPSGSSGAIVVGGDPAVDRVAAGGSEFMATHLADLRAEEPDSLVVAAGDLIGASPLLSALFRDEPSIEAVNAMGLDLASIGNHELDGGLDELYRMQRGGCHPADGCLDGDGFAGAAFDYLAANVVFDDTGQTILPPYAIRNVGNARVAFIGLTLEGTPDVTTADRVVGLSFGDEAETVNALVPHLRARGVEAIVVLLHEGGFAGGGIDDCVAISGRLFDVVRRFDRAVDVVVAGHTNAAHVCDVDGILVTSAASFGRLITDIDLTIDELGGDVTAKVADNVIVTRDVPADPVQADLIARYRALSGPLASRIVGRVDGDLVRTGVESTMGNFLADAYLALGRADGVEVALVNPGGVRADILAGARSGGEPIGAITYGELFAVQPFGNVLVSLDLTGAQLDALLEQQWSSGRGGELASMLAVSSGFRYAYDPRRPIGDRIAPGAISLHGQPIAPERSYRVSVNSFLAAGGDGFTVLTAARRSKAGQIDLQGLQQYLAEAGTVIPPALGRVRNLAE